MRNELLFKSVQSLLDNWQDSFELIIVDQSERAKEKVFTYHAEKEQASHIHIFDVPFDSGLSYCRNFGVKKAHELNCEYVIIGSDSFLFNESIKKINEIIKILNLKIWCKERLDLIGFELENCCCDWEANLNMIENKSFELDFIEKSRKNDLLDLASWTRASIYKCDIVRNFFITRTYKLIDVAWDNNLKLGEHEDFFWRFKRAGYKVAWTDYIKAEKMTNRSNKYAKFRQINFQEGLKYLREKYNISGWVTYKNLERAKRKKS